MNGRRYQRKRSFKRGVVTLLALVMLVSVCFPAFRVSAESVDDVEKTETNTVTGTADTLGSGENSGEDAASGDPATSGDNTLAGDDDTDAGDNTTTSDTTGTGNNTVAGDTNSAGNNVTTEDTTNVGDNTTTSDTTNIGENTTTSDTTNIGENTTTSDTTNTGDNTTTSDTTNTGDTNTSSSTDAGSNAMTGDVTTSDSQTSVSTEETNSTVYEELLAIFKNLAEEATKLEAARDALDAFFFDRLQVEYTKAQEMWCDNLITDEQLEQIEEKTQEIRDYLLETYGYSAEFGNPDGAVLLADAKGPERTKVDGVAENVKINLFNYDTNIDLNSNAVLRFRAQLDDSNYYNRDVYQKTADSGEYIDKVNGDGGNTVGTPSMYLNLGNDGYPNVKSVSNGDKVTSSGSLAYLFDPEVSAMGKTYYPVNNDGTGTGLFQKDADGYYYYKSAYNHAEYINGKFQLYDFALRPFGGRIDNRGQGHFLPFNTDTSRAVQITDKNGNWVHPTTEEYKNFWGSVNLWDTTKNEFAYSGTLSNNAELAPNVWVLGNTYSQENHDADLANLPDYWYGFSVEITFNITETEDGKPVIVDSNGNTQNMIFSFLGDDDVFVYLDDVLVLDLGGGSCDYGEINFTEGTSYEKGGSSSSVPAGSTGNAYTRKINDIFNAALNEAGKAQNYDYETAFKQYSTHTLKFFYLERGTGTANNELKFNMDPMPAGQINVTKTIDNSSDVTKETANDEYTFGLYEHINDGWVAVTGAEYKIGALDAQYTDGSGQFKLKKDQTASFTKLAAATIAGREFKVVEITSDMVDATFEGVSYSGSANGSVIGNTYAVFTIFPDDQDEGRSHTVIFTNKLKTTDFAVAKNVKGNMGDVAKDFSFNAKWYYDEDKTKELGNEQFTLKNGETKTFTNVPIGAYVEVIEDDYSNLEYVTKVRVDDCEESENLIASFKTTLTEGDHKVVFTNEKNVPIDTGFSFDSYPFILLLSTAIVAAFVLIMGKLRYRREF